MTFEEALRTIESLLESQAKLSGRGSLELLLRHPDTINALSIACQSLKICSGKQSVEFKSGESQAVESKSLKPKSGQFWRAEDERKLAALVKGGSDIQDAAKALGRSISSTRSRAMKLGLFEDLSS